MRWWLQGALEDLRESYRALGSELLFFRGNPGDILKEIGPKQVLTLGDQAWLTPKDTLTNSEGNPLRVFTPFWKRFQQSIHPRAPLPAPKKLLSPGVEGAPINMASKAPWEAKLAQYFKPTRQAALDMLGTFHPEMYADKRNDPTKRGTSLLSPYLAAGLISPFEIYHRFRDHDPFIRQLVWREFAHYLLTHYPTMAHEPFDPKFKDFPWDHNEEYFERWKRGQTGYPIVDAGMRQLWETGWMHNRLRMIVGSFLVKDLNISWTRGMNWFWDTLIDADLGNNTFGWQWVGGMGPDASPFFRVFNPLLQSKKFDPEGAFIRRFVPELRNVDPKEIHEPKNIPGYPKPLIDHAEAARAAKERFSRV